MSESGNIRVLEECIERMERSAEKAQERIRELEVEIGRLRDNGQEWRRAFDAEKAENANLWRLDTERALELMKVRKELKTAREEGRREERERMEKLERIAILAVNGVPCSHPSMGEAFDALLPPNWSTMYPHEREAAIRARGKE